MPYFDAKTWTTSRTVTVGVGSVALCTAVGLAMGTDAFSSLVVGLVLGLAAAKSISSGMKKGQTE